ncbi:hypothetical protein IEQ34_008727 [Dendrobium chrysotoxum]|uniref:Bulb-type lectin domain-containing protein n=1 Tax=Dendrobium chrysotoxum TaxID=161865 RepID=A0AAV7GYQ5_DENCH|nr:hypothetical protein IEQ34_008727 [Dendrobium chrysotoxum]
MAINIASASTLLSSSILLLLIASCSSTRFGFPTGSGNVLTSGQELSTDKSLSIGNYNFAMQRDCNLVLYENDIVLWASNTPKRGSNCRLLLQSNGELQIISDLGALVWRTETGGEYGKYALVLQPNGNVVIYRSPVWSTGTHTQSKTVNAAPKNSVSQNP